MYERRNVFNDWAQYLSLSRAIRQGENAESGSLNIEERADPNGTSISPMSH